MKIFKFLIIALLVFLSCQKQPTAKFVAQSENYWTFEPVTFKNLSFDSYYFKWDFGDSTTTEAFDFVHYYEKPGEYMVSLTAYSENRKLKDTYLKNVTITQPTDLVVKISPDSQSLNKLDSFYITTFMNLFDYENYINIIDSAFTDIYGIAVIRDIASQIYYIDVFKKVPGGYWSNGETGYITEKLMENEVNYYHIKMKYYDNQ